MTFLYWQVRLGWLPFRCLLATLQVPASFPLGPCQLPLGPCQLPLGPCQLPFRSLMDILQNLTVKTVLSVSIFVLQIFLSATKISASVLSRSHLSESLFFVILSVLLKKILFIIFDLLSVGKFSFAKTSCHGLQSMHQHNLLQMSSN